MISRRTCSETVPIDHLILDLATSGSAPSWNGPTSCGGDKSREVLGPCNVALGFIWTTPKEFGLESFTLGIGCG